MPLDFPRNLRRNLVGLLALAAASAASAQTIETWAGGGVGDGGPAVQAYIGEPGGSVVAANGDVYFVERWGNRVRRIDAAGVISTVAGTGAAGFSGDGGPATAAMLDSPDDVVFDGAGNLYISDSDNYRVRVVGTDGVIRTVAGNGANLFAGDGGPALAASLADPEGLAIDAQGRVYVADRLAHRIRRFTVGGSIETVAGNGDVHSGDLAQAGDGGAATSARLYNPGTIAIDSAGRLVIAEYYPGVIRRVDGAGIITTIVGTWSAGASSPDGVPAVDANFSGLAGFGYDAAGNLYIGEMDAHKIRRISPAGVVTTLNGSDVGAVRDLGVYPDGRVVFSTNSDERALRRLLANGTVEHIAGGGYGVGAALPQMFLIDPKAVAIDADGNVLFADERRLFRAPAAGVASEIAGVSEYTGGIAVAADGTVYYSDDEPLGSGRINYLDGNGDPQVFTDDPQLHSSLPLAIGDDGAIYTLGDQRVLRVSAAGAITVVAGTGAEGDSGDGGPASAATMGKYLSGIALGPDGSVYFGDRSNQRIRRIAPDGSIHAFAGNGSTDPEAAEGVATEVGFSDIKALAVDGEGNVLIGDGARVRRVTTDGQIATFAGTGAYATTGDGGLAVDASLMDAMSLAVDGEQNVYIADNDARIRRVLADAGPILPTAPRDVVAHAGDGTAFVAFAAPATAGSSPIVQYVVEASPVGGSDAQAGSAQLVHLVSGLTNGQAYTFTVHAVTADGIGPKSAPSSPVTPTAGSLPQLYVTGLTIAEGIAGDQPLQLDVRLDRAQPNAVTFTIDDLGSSNPLPGQAQADVDYSFPAQSLAIAAASLQASASFTVRGDPVREPTETFAVALASVVGAVPVGNATVTLLDGDGSRAKAPLFAGRDDRQVVPERDMAFIDVLRNDLFTRSRMLGATITIVEPPLRGTANVVDAGVAGDAADDVIAYTGNFIGDDAFGYEVCEAAGRCYYAVARVWIGNRLPIIESPAERGAFAHSRSNLRTLTDVRYMVMPSLATSSDDGPLGVDVNPASPWNDGGAGTLTMLHALPTNNQSATMPLRVVAHMPPKAAVDMYVGVDSNGNGVADESELRCTSASAGAAAETCDFAYNRPGNVALDVWVLLHNTGTVPTSGAGWVHSLSTSAATTTEEFTASGPAKVEFDGAWDMDLSWNLPLTVNGNYRAALVVVTSGGQTIEVSPLIVQRTARDAAGSRLLDGVPLTLALLPGQAHDRLFVDVPAGATSLTVTATANRNIDVYLARDADPDGPRIAPAPARGAAQASGTGPGNEQVVVSGVALTPGRWYVTPVDADSKALQTTITATIVAATPAVRTGSYFNPERSGHGIFLHPAGDTWAGLWYTYRNDGRPTWYYLQATAPAAGKAVWASKVYRSTWNGTSNRLVAIGDASVTAVGPDRFQFTHTVDGVTASETMQALGRGCPTFAGNPLDASNHWFDPAKAGTGFSVQYWPNYEYYAAYVYDARGEATFLAAESSGFAGGDATLDIDQIEGFCPSCDFSPVQHTTVGTLHRTLGTGTITAIDVDAIYVDAVPGFWSAVNAVQPLGGVGTSQGCTP